ncbi:MAG: hypothetical protein SFU27_01755, partial [Thermonemataceae bacterium]|nr:hypothetical protein [Thermonemataceae bacterium]
MRKIVSTFSILAMLFVLTACPYSAEFSLDSPKERINSSYIGTWSEESSFENPAYFVISKKDANAYVFEKNEYSTEKKLYEKKTYTGHITTLGNVQFLNLKDEEENKYYFHKIELSSDKKQIIMFEVTDNIDEKFSNSVELKAFFDKYK